MPKPQYITGEFMRRFMADSSETERLKIYKIYSAAGTTVTRALNANDSSYQGFESSFPKQVLHDITMTDSETSKTLYKYSLTPIYDHGYYDMIITNRATNSSLYSTLSALYDMVFDVNDLKKASTKEDKNIKQVLEAYKKTVGSINTAKNQKIKTVNFKKPPKSDAKVVRIAQMDIPIHIFAKINTRKDIFYRVIAHLILFKELPEHMTNMMKGEHESILVIDQSHVFGDTHKASYDVAYALTPELMKKFTVEFI